MMKSKVSQVLLSALIVSTLAGYTAEGHNPTHVPEVWNPDSVAEYLTYMRRFHDTETILRDRRRTPEDKKESASKTLEWLQNEIEGHEILASASIQVYKLRLMCLLSSDMDEKQRIARDLIDNHQWGIAILASLPAYTGNLRREESNLHRTMVGDLLPLSRFRTLADGQNRVTGSIHALMEIPMVPLLPNRDTMAEIGTLWAEAGFYDDAALAYREAIYGYWMLNLRRFDMQQGWLGRYAADIWIRVAQCERRAGRYADAVESVSKAMIYGKMQHFEQGKELISNMLIDIDDNKITVDTPSLERSVLLEIIGRYRRLNAHPRAFWLLEKHRDVLGPDFDETWNTVAEEWLVICRRTLSQYPALPKDKGRVFLYGHNIVPEDERLNVRVPPLLHGDALEKAIVIFEKLISGKPQGQTLE